MASVTNYSGYNQAGAQQAYGSYAAPPAQGYGQTAQQGYTQQDYASYAQAQPAATDSAYAQTASSTGGYTQQQYAAAYGQSTTPAAYSTPQAGAQGYTQPAQTYGTSSYASSTATAPPATQASYGTQSGYSAQSAYSGYGQQAASATQSYSASTQPAYSQGGYQPRSRPTEGSSSLPTLRPRPNSRRRLLHTLLHPTDPTVSLSTASPALLRPATTSPDLMVVMVKAV
ncbi:hypothetical protein AMELA_G00236320 [Ameiurus melas]|uniref:RNA-binding protein EWS n=1 Tax=Ameiurus melas TaxID=219545 RepID=A0A7J5ZWS3_AMEME|nr:hypothetical protein AMELA_G00236320 [Ameiurus melas]